MKQIKYNYLNYNQLTNNELLSTIEKIPEDTLIIVENELAKKQYSSYINKGQLRIKTNIISFEDFLDKIFISNRKILRDIKRFFLFYSYLKDETKKKFNITSYFDCIEIADDFFEFFSYIKNKEDLDNLNLSKWQEEKFELFFEIKNEMDKFLNENAYLPSDWLYSITNLKLDFLKKYKKLVFFDIVDFPYNFSKILETLKNYYDIEITLQMEDKDFNKDKLKLNKVSLIDKKLDIELVKYSNELELYTMILSKQYDNYYTTDANKEDKYSIFTKSNKFYLNDTKFYKIIEAYLNLLNGIDYKNRNLIDIFLVKENIFNSAFMEFYGLDVEDYKCFEKIISRDYRYISLTLLKEEYYSHFLNDDENLKTKLNLIFETLNSIEKINDISDLNSFLCANFFNSKTDINFFIENKFDSLYDKIYEVLGLLNSNENIEFFNNFNSFFKTNIGKNIFTLFFNYLNKIDIYSVENNKNKDKELKNLNLIKYSAKNIENSALLYADSQSLPKTKVNNTMFTEQQKIKLALKTNEEEILIQKYRFFQNILNLDKITVYSLVNQDINIDFSPFIYELINKYSAKELDISDLKGFFKACYLQNKTEVFKKEKVFFRAFSKKNTDFINNTLTIGAYDYILLKKNETFFFLDKICGIESISETSPVNGISPKVLGNILHKTLEDIFKTNWKNILNDSNKLLLSKEEIKKYLEKYIWQENLKIENFMELYLNEVLFPRLIDNIEKFLEVLHEELKDTKIKRIEAEKESTTKNVAYLEHKGIQIVLNGRADLLIETEKARYIIDFKTGSYDKNQLEFYALMFYGSDTSLPVYSATYNFWEEEKAFDFNKHLVNNLEEKDSNFKTFLRDFLDKDHYTLSSKSSLKENGFDFNEYYRYRNIISLEKISDIGGSDE